MDSFYTNLSIHNKCHHHWCLKNNTRREYLYRKTKMKPKKQQFKNVVSSRSSQLNLRKNSQLIGETIPQNLGTCKSFTYICSGCSKPIKKDKFLLKACDKFWHENCLRCDRCHSRLGELGSTLYCKSNMNLCRQDYLEMFGETGVCSVCEKLICASEMVMRARENVYHLECFSCQLCNQRFCVGDRFYLCENKVVCQYDYEEHILPIQRSLLEQIVDSQTSTIENLESIGGKPDSMLHTADCNYSNQLITHQELSQQEGESSNQEKDVKEFIKDLEICQKSVEDEEEEDGADEDDDDDELEERKNGIADIELERDEEKLMIGKLETTKMKAQEA